MLLLLLTFNQCHTNNNKQCLTRLGISLSLHDNVMHLVLQCECRKLAAHEPQQREVSRRRWERHLCLLPRSSIWPRTHLTMPRHATVFCHHQSRRDNNTSKTTWLRSPAFSLHLAGAPASARHRRTTMIRTHTFSSRKRGLCDRPPYHDLIQASRAFCGYYAPWYGVLPSYRGKMSPKNYYC